MKIFPFNNNIFLRRVMGSNVILFHLTAVVSLQSPKKTHQNVFPIDHDGIQVAYLLNHKHFVLLGVRPNCPMNMACLSLTIDYFILNLFINSKTRKIIFKDEIWQASRFTICSLLSPRNHPCVHILRQ